MKRHRLQLKSLYLRNIDNLRAGAEYALMFQLFFSIVSCFLIVISYVYYLNATNVCLVSLACHSD